MADEHTRKMEREHLHRQLRAGRRPSELHALVDQAVDETIRRLDSEADGKRRIEAGRDLLAVAAVAAVEHLRPLTSFADSHLIVEQLEKALADAGLTPWE